MKKDKIIYKLKEVLTNKKKRSMLLIISAVGIVFTVLIFKADYIKSVIDGDPNYEKLKEKMAVYAYRKTISLEEFEEGGKLVEDSSDKPKGPITAANVLGGFDQYTPTSVTNDESDDSNNSNWSGTNENNTNTSNDKNNNNTNSNSNSTINNIQGQSDVNKEETIIDKSSFTGKDVIVLEAEKFDPFKILQLAARDIDGKNITDKIVITENNVNIYKPGLYDVKANVELSDGRKLYKEFLVRVEGKLLELVVDNIETSKEFLEKNEVYTMALDIAYSKEYLDVSSININGIDYPIKKTKEKSLIRKHNKYEVELVASSKAGIQELNVNSITMSDGVIVDISKTVNIEVLKEQATISDVIVQNVDENGEKIQIAFEIKDIDNTLDGAKICIYDDNDEVVAEKEVARNQFITSILEVNKDGVYTIKVMATIKNEDFELVYKNNKLLRQIELFSKLIQVNNIHDEEAYDEVAQIQVVSEVSLSARTMNGESQDNDKKEDNVEVKVEVVSEEKDSTTNKIHVTVPTTAAFTIMQDSSFVASDIKVSNYGSQNIDVILTDFIDVTRNDDIELITNDDVSQNTVNYSRKQINLWMEGNRKSVLLSSNMLFYDGISGNTIDNPEDRLLSVIKPGDTTELKLRGVAGNNNTPITRPIQDRFTLRLRIRKSNKN